ncbi:hypothetical protein BR93DRAFT_966790 [Coniochaeta sp. PMI_546]|nr:hypothetical protein BR93DRAFT_966790 [Coniochaeta sp. PMI_546]
MAELLRIERGSNREATPCLLNPVGVLVWLLPSFADSNTGSGRRQEQNGAPSALTRTGKWASVSGERQHLHRGLAQAVSAQ